MEPTLDVVAGDLNVDALILQIGMNWGVDHYDLEHLDRHTAMLQGVLDIRERHGIAVAVVVPIPYDHCEGQTNAALSRAISDAGLPLYLQHSRCECAGDATSADLAESTSGTGEQMSDQTNDIYEIMQTQRAIRRWTDAPVDREMIERIIQTACWAPSGSNSQPWGFVVVTDDGKRWRLADAMREGFQKRIGASFPNPDEMVDPIRRRMYRGAKALFEDFAAAPVWVIPCLLADSVAQAGQPAGRE